MSQEVVTGKKDEASDHEKKSGFVSGWTDVIGHKEEEKSSHGKESKNSSVDIKDDFQWFTILSVD